MWIPRTGVNSSSLAHIFLTEGVGAMFNQLKIKVMIHDVEELCLSVGYTIDHEELAQKKIEEILNYLIEWGVINKYCSQNLDWIFSKEQTY